METLALDELFGDEEFVFACADKKFMERVRLEYKALRKAVDALENTGLILTLLEDSLIGDIYKLEGLPPEKQTQSKEA